MVDISLPRGTRSTSGGKSWTPHIDHEPSKIHLLLVDTRFPDAVVDPGKSHFLDEPGIMPSKSRNHSQQKKSAGSRNNPLAQARGQQKAPENVWFRRSGAGFRLFVEYYSQQPVGVVTSSTTAMTANGGDDRHHNETETPSQALGGTRKRNDREDYHPPGMSRAAKRRRKRNKMMGGDCKQNHNQSRVIVSEQDRRTPLPKPNSLPPSFSGLRDDASRDASPLLSAATTYLEAHKHKHKHKNDMKDFQTHRLRVWSFFEFMSRPLPTTFRIRNSATQRHCDQLLQELQSLSQAMVSPIPLQPATSKNTPKLFQCPLAKSQLSAKAPQLKELLLHYSQNGTLARQELGSMLPVLMLSQGGHVNEGDCVVDMCASPGSKTLQAVELVVRGTNTDHSRGRQGLVLANDVLESRLDALRAAVKRSGVPESYIQRIRYSQVDATKLSLSSLCDAVLCDVPCSGDGTCRKDPHILPMWKPQAGNSLHATQLLILKRSLELVKVGGVVCYSTCSLNPVEDEAVVAAALKTFQGKVELLKLTGLNGWRHQPGVLTWKVAHYVDEAGKEREGSGKDNVSEELPQLSWYETFDEAKSAGDMEEADPAMWPSPSNASLHLDRCARLLPQDYDSGGFFLALLKKCK